MKHINPITGEADKFNFIYRLSTQHPQFKMSTLNSILFQLTSQLPVFEVDQFGLKRKNPGTGTCPLTSPDSRKFLVFNTFSLFYSLILTSIQPSPHAPFLTKLIHAANLFHPVSPSLALQIPGQAGGLAGKKRSALRRNPGSWAALWDGCRPLAGRG